MPAPADAAQPRVRRTAATPRLTFDFTARDGFPVRRVYSHPLEVVTAEAIGEVLPALAAVEQAVAAGRHAAGYLAYEAAPAFEPACRVRPGNRMPLLWLGIFDEPAVTVAAPPAPHVTDAAAAVKGWILETSRERYDADIAAIREALAEGRTYQVNHTSRLRARFEGDPAALYDRLRRAQGPGFHAHLDLGRFRILSASPELFFRRRGAELVTRPMKGTRPRGRWPAEDAAAARALAESEKDRAENLMIVDLLRNDLGRIAETGSVRVPELFTVERYRTVWQMTSTVSARVAPGRGLTDLFRAMFPSGSVTGAPKISTMELIARLEESPREVYCGAIGFVEPGGDCTFNVPIRTAWIDAQHAMAEYGIGGGITWDSTASAELDELFAKAAVLREHWPPFELIETMRLERGRIPRLERHLARLRASADYFGFRFTEAAVRATLDALARAEPVDARRVRLLLSERGTAHVTSDPLSAAPAAPPAVALARGPVASADRFLFHKTTNRAAYDAHAAARPDLFDVLLWNERGEVTEFTRGNIAIALDGERITPPLAAGLLAGCFRAELLDAGAIVERAVRLDDLRDAARLWLINSVREWTEVRLLPD